jgi:hypothetical protein
MKNFEPGSILKQSDYKKPSRREEFSLLFIAAICSAGLVVAFVLPLLK